MLIALTRDLSPAIGRCELTHLERAPIDLPLARAQHGAYEACLASAGCRVERLAAGPEMPDSVFIEDTAVVFDEVAILTRPGAVSRRVETAAVADALRPLSPAASTSNRPAPSTAATCSSSDGACSSDDRAGPTTPASRRCAVCWRRYGYEVTTIEVRGCLHLKSAVTAVGDDLLLMNSAWLPLAPFARSTASTCTPTSRRPPMR